MPLNFSHLIDNYCQAKAKADAKLDNPNLKYCQKIENAKLISAILNYYEKDFKRNYLGTELYRYKSEYFSYLGEILAKVSTEICEKYDRDYSLITWINNKLGFKNRVKEEIRKETIPKGFPNLSSLNEMLKQEDGTTLERMELVRSDRKEGLDLMAEKEVAEECEAALYRKKERGKISISNNSIDFIKIDQQEDFISNPTPTALQQWLDYLENDPDNFFKDEYCKDREGNPCLECNNHLILKITLLEDIKNSIIINQAQVKIWFCRLKTLAEKFNVSEGTLNSRLQHPKRPHTIQNYALGFGISYGIDERFINISKLKQVIENDHDRFLRNDYLRNHKLCHSQWLAQKRLPYFVEVTTEFNELVTLLAQQNEKYYRLQPEQIENHWFKHTLPRLGQLAARLIPFAF